MLESTSVQVTLTLICNNETSKFFFIPISKNMFSSVFFLLINRRNNRAWRGRGGQSRFITHIGNTSFSP